MLELIVTVLSLSSPSFRRAIVSLVDKSTSGHTWSENDGWFSDEQECTWIGVTYCNMGKMVIDLDLSFNHLIESIPVEIMHMRMIGQCLRFAFSMRRF